MNPSCPECGATVSPAAVMCECGRRLKRARKRGIPLYLAALPLMLPAFFLFRPGTDVGPVAASLVRHEGKPRGLAVSSCVDTSGVRLVKRREGAVLRGTVENRCGEALEGVVLHIVGRDGEAALGGIDFKVGGLKPGATKPIEYAWRSRVTDWVITSNK